MEERPELLRALRAALLGAKRVMFVWFAREDVKAVLEERRVLRAERLELVLMREVRFMVVFAASWAKARVAAKAAAGRACLICMVSGVAVVERGKEWFVR